ncbi:MAG TPA: hypothetical protein VH222_02445 [Phenylobacterium sp.]|jgi:hypothetical protein|nr:hypothetical protein [Phenylobacterium sp.]
MRINVRRFDGGWFLIQQGVLEQDRFKGLSDALNEAVRRFRSAGQDGPASLSISYDELPSGPGSPALEPLAAP